MSEVEPFPSLSGLPGATGEAVVPRPRIDLLALDLDGTLLRSDKRISGVTIDAIHAAQRNGTRVVIATARPPRSTRKIHKALGLDTYSIHYNGALIQDLTRGKVVDHQPIAVATVKKIIAAARKVDPECMVSIEILDKWYTDQCPSTHGLVPETGRLFEPDFIGPLGAFLKVPVTKLMLLAPPSRIAKVRDLVLTRFKGEVSVAVCDQYLLQIAATGVDKGTALAKLAQHYGAARENVMAMGDAPNDIGMIRWAGLGVAMANAWPNVLEASDVVVGPNDLDGVGQAIREFILDA